jgi:hypothetical protein
MAPVVAVPISADLRPPEAVSRLNYVFFTPPHEFEHQIDKLVKALNTNLDWIKEHTRLGELARRWNERGKPSGLLLAASEIGEAERWVVARLREAPAPTDLHVEFVQASRQQAIRRQRTWIAGSMAVAVAALVLAGFAYWQRETAVKSEARAVASEQLAKENERRAEQQRDDALITQSRFLAELAQRNWTRANRSKASFSRLRAYQTPNRSLRAPMSQRQSVLLMRANLDNARSLH